MSTIDIDGWRVNYSDAGRGTALVFVHGLVGSKDWFGYQVNGLADHYRTISYDLRRARWRADYALDGLAEDLARLLDRLRVPSTVAIGTDLGAMVCARFAAAHPERCSKLVMCSAAPSFGHLTQEETVSVFAPGPVRVDSALARAWRHITGAKRVSARTDPDSVLPELDAELDRRTLASRLSLLRNTDLSADLSNIVVPVLIIAGSQSPEPILSGAQALEQLISDATVEVIEDADQFCYYTRHDMFNFIVDDYISHGQRGV